MAEQGGYRQPSNPAPVSGPGPLSQRTDGGAVEGMSKPQPKSDWKGLPYGQNKAVNDQQSQGDLAGSGIPNVAIPAIPLSAPSQRPDEHIATRSTEPLPNMAPTIIDTIRHLATFDPSGDAELIYRSLSDGNG